MIWHMKINKKKIVKIIMVKTRFWSKKIFVKKFDKEKIFMEEIWSKINLVYKNFCVRKF